MYNFDWATALNTISLPSTIPSQLTITMEQPPSPPPMQLPVPEPTITAYTPPNGPRAGGTAGYDRCAASERSHVPPRGTIVWLDRAGTWVTVTGQMFPAVPSVVRIGENECRALTVLSSTHLVCLTSPSYSRSENTAIEISVERQVISVLGFSYDPPAVLGTYPPNAAAECAPCRLA
jgi:hypothetical protein